MNEEAIFTEAVQVSQPQRSAYLDTACAGDAQLRARVELLLDAHDRPDPFFSTPGQGPMTLPDPPMSEKAGSVIGPYQLLQQIGEGGMGVVWMAEQTHPVQRKVALKVIKPGMDSRQVIARFDAERQALALMDHANIARVLDAGATDAGRPYFVMDLVKGVPITRYCDEHHLTPRQRLELFIPVCHAIQHAHQKGIIHRDLKPSNVLVALYDDKPVPKVIDFGVAKATGPKLTGLTLNTCFGTVVGTLEYMSPEQAGFNQLDIDTRSDIYSLGVLLYELLAGSPPFSPKELEQAGLLEMLRVIREHEPSKPSTKLSSSDVLPSLSANRGTEPARLTKLVRGELDWIVMKALEKDRARRYETANGFAQDLQRYLADEPVQACPPSAAYRLRKFTRRNKVALITAGLVTFALMAGTFVSAWQAIRATRAEAVAQQGWESEALARRDADAARRQAEANFQKALEAVDQMLTEVGEESLANIPQMEPVRRALLQKALNYYQDFLRQKATEPLLRFETGRAYQRVSDIQRLLGAYKQAQAACREAIAILEKLEADFPHEPAYQHALAESYRCLGGTGMHAHREEADRAYEQAIRRHVRLADTFPDKAEYKNALGKDYHSFAYHLRLNSQPAEAEQTYLKAIDLHRQLLAVDPESAEYRYRLGQHYRALGVAQWSAGRLKEAEVSLLQAIDWQRTVVNDQPSVPRHRQQLAKSHFHLAMVLRANDRTLEAREPYVAAKTLQDALAKDFPSVPEYRLDLAETLQGLGIVELLAGHLDEAKQHFAEGIRLGSPAGTTHNNVAWTIVALPDPAPDAAAWAVDLAERAVELEPRNGTYWNTLGVARYRAAQWNAAIAALEKSRQLFQGRFEGFNRFVLAMAHCRLGAEAEARQHYEQGVRWLEDNQTAVEKNRKHVEELRRLRAEAATLLRIEHKSAESGSI